MLLLISKNTKLKANHNRGGGGGQKEKLLLISKNTKLKANHNFHAVPTASVGVVAYQQKYKIESKSQL